MRNKKITQKEPKEKRFDKNIFSCYHLVNSILIHQERRRDWPFEDAATFGFRKVPNPARISRKMSKLQRFPIFRVGTFLFPFPCP